LELAARGVGDAAAADSAGLEEASADGEAAGSDAEGGARAVADGVEERSWESCPGAGRPQPSAEERKMAATPKIKRTRRSVWHAEMRFAFSMTAKSAYPWYRIDPFSMDQTLLRSYLATVYEFMSPSGPVRASLDGDVAGDPSTLPELLRKSFAVLTAYNPRSMLLPRKVNDQRQQVMRDLLVLGVHRVEPCVGFEDDPEGTWREPSWIVHGMEREEAIAFGLVFRQNSIVLSVGGRPEIIVTDPTCDDVGRTYTASWRVRSS